jgi:1-acyl-sn-glycerol-3-phosphate acyltransferase
MISKKLSHTPFTQSLARWILRKISWKLDVQLPDSQKFVLVGAPHTSNWDLFYALLFQYGAGIEFHWIGKDILFRGPWAGLMRWLGGIPVVRRSRNNFVDQIVKVFDQHDKLVIAIAPEGTRRKSDYWKTGFYYIALGAKVPIALGYLDYPNKVVGIGSYFIPSGDIQSDFAIIKEFYKDKRGKFPKMQGSIQLRPAISN